MIENPGRYDISFEEYKKDPCVIPSLSRSAIVDILDSPARCFWNHPRLNPNLPAEKEKIQFDIGSAAHDLLLKGGDSIFVVEGFDDWRKKEAQQARDAAREIGKTPLLEKHFTEVACMVGIAQAALANCKDLGINDLRAEGDSEVTYLWREDETWFKIRPDWISADKKKILDYKTTGTSADPQDFGKIVISSGLDVQESLYRRGVKAVEGTEPEFYFIVQETEPPYLCSFLQLDPAFQKMGKQKVEQGLKRWRECLSTGKWPGYPSKIATIEAPAWAVAAWEFRAMMMQEASDVICF